MNAELAVQLKEAGYPQSGDPLVTKLPDRNELLKEVMKISGTNNVGLARTNDGQWHASANIKLSDRDNKRTYMADGDTGEEALARLYIALKK